MVNSKITEKVFAICKSEEMLILLGKNLFPWLFGIFKKHLYGR